MRPPSRLLAQIVNDKLIRKVTKDAIEKLRAARRHGRLGILNIAISPPIPSPARIFQSRSLRRAGLCRNFGHKHSVGVLVEWQGLCVKRKGFPCVNHQTQSGLSTGLQILAWNMWLPRWMIMSYTSGSQPPMPCFKARLRWSPPGGYLWGERKDEWKPHQSS